MPDELDREHQPVAPSPGGGETPPPLAGHSPGRGAEHGLRAGAGGTALPARDTRPDHATRFLETTRGVLSYSEVAPLLAERVLRLETALYQPEFASWPPDERLAAEFHRRICHDLVPEWAGRWRTIAVRVGHLTPPPPHQVPLLMRNYGADLLARWPAASAATGDLTLELLAFAEGRFLSIHPFQDFNGRAIRLFLLELLRRLDLPRVVLAPAQDSERQAYFLALEAADHSDWQPLVAIWQSRFTTAPQNPSAQA